MRALRTAVLLALFAAPARADVRIPPPPPPPPPGGSVVQPVVAGAAAALALAAAGVWVLRRGTRKPA